jgi:hypothetical protein
MAKGNHIAVRDGLAVHHGIDCGNGTVVEFEGFSVDAKPLRLVTLEEFTEGHGYVTVESAGLFDAELVAWLALDRLLAPDLWAGPAEPPLLAA